ncbi:MAG: DUF192 domain-containing protein [Gammaproteobacteria bacterium]|nr:DUF192 domain-containing protein [Gammaproteobacteria bacterium]
MKRALIGAGLMLCLLSRMADAAEPAFLLREFRQVQGMLESATGCQFLDVWLAVTPEQRAQGLMYVRELGAYESMLFTTPQPAVLSMWMKNTYIPLDMIFIGTNSRVSSIAADRVPLSEESVKSTEPVVAILEVNGGYAARHRVRHGDRFVLFN